MDARSTILIKTTEEAVRTTGQPLSLSRLLKWQTLKNYFFLCLFLRKRFLRLCVAILCLLCFFPFGIGQKN